MRLRMLLSAGAAVLAGCGGGAALGGGATVMVYAVPDGNPLTYERSDSMAISIEAPGMGSLTLRIDQAMTLGMAFTASAAGVQVTTAVESLSARMTNPLSAPVMLTESDVQGDLVISTDGRGDAELIELPEVSNVGGPAFNVTALANELLPKLPPRGVMPGGSWVDTTSYMGSDATGSIDVTWVGTSTLVGDTVVDGRGMILVRTEAEVAIEVAATVAGMDVTQTMSGPETGFYLWDPSRRALFLQEIDRDLAGSVRVPVVPGPMNLTAKQRRTMKIVGG